MHHLFGSMFTSKSPGDMFVLNKRCGEETNFQGYKDCKYRLKIGMAAHRN